MSFKRSNRRDTQGQGKTGWEHLTDWISGSSDTSDESLNDPNVILRGRFNPLHLKLGEMVELSLHTKKTAYEVDGIICFEPLGRGERATRYEFKDTSPPLILEGLEASEGVLYTLYELADEFKLDPQLLNICRSEDRLEHEIETEGEIENIQYIKDAEARSKALVYTHKGAETLDVFGFYYTTEDEGFSDELKNKHRFLTVETWSKARWMRFYTGHELRPRHILSLGTFKDQ